MARKDTDWSELKTVALGNKSLMVHKRYRKEERSLETPIFTSQCNCHFSWPASNTKNSLYSYFLRFGVLSQGGSSPVHSFSPRLVWAPESPSPRVAESLGEDSLSPRPPSAFQAAPRHKHLPISKNGEAVRRARDPSPPPFLTSSTLGTQIWSRHHAKRYRPAQEPLGYRTSLPEIDERWDGRFWGDFPLSV